MTTKTASGCACDDLRQCLDDVFVALAARHEAEGEDHLLADHAVLLLVIRGIEEGHVGHAVRNDRNPARRDAIDLAQDLGGALAHHHDPIRQAADGADDLLLVLVGLLEDGVEGGDDRHAQVLQQADDIVARLAAIDAELVLEADGIDAVHVEEVDGAAVVADDPLADLELHLGRVVVAERDVVHRHRPQFGVRRMRSSWRREDRRRRSRSRNVAEGSCR